MRDRIALGVLALVPAVFGYQGLTGPDGALRAEQDHTITLSLSRQLETYHEYHPDFVYPLPAVVMKLALGAVGTQASSLIWMALMIAAGVGCVHALSLLLPPRPGRDRYAAPLLGALAIVYCVQWDFRAVNANTIFLALALFAFVALQRGRDGAAGGLLAASVALKLYSAPLLLLVALRGSWRSVAWAIAWGIGFFVVLPALWFGPATALHLSGLWLDQIVATASPEAAVRITAYNVSLQTLVRAVGELGPGGSTQAAALVSRAIGLTFAAGVAVWLTRTRTVSSDDEPIARADASVVTAIGLVLAAMLLLSPLAQPHHGVVLWPLAAVTAHGALDESSSRRRRGIAGVLLGAVFVLLVVAPSGVGKAVAQNGAILLLVFGGVLVSRPIRRDA